MEKEIYVGASLVEPVVRQEVTRKALLSQLGDLEEQLANAKLLLEDESELVVSLAEELENLGNDQKKIQGELTEHSNSLEFIIQRRSDMTAAILAMTSQIESKEAEVDAASVADEKKLKSLKANYEKTCSQYFDVMSTWSETEKAVLKELSIGLGGEREASIETDFKNQFDRLKEEFGPEAHDEDT